MSWSLRHVSETTYKLWQRDCAMNAPVYSNLMTLFEGGWVTLSANFSQKGHRPQTTVGVGKLK